MHPWMGHAGAEAEAEDGTTSRNMVAVAQVRTSVSSERISGLPLLSYQAESVHL